MLYGRIAMKKILTIVLLFLLSINIVSAKEKQNYKIKFNKETYNLLYSTKNPEFGGYLNEYYKWNETYNRWSEMVAIHHFPNAYSPIDQIKTFREYLGSLNCPSAITFDDKKNVGIIDFIMINDHQLPIILEFNVFKYEKSKKCGSVAIQYAKRYVVTTALQMEAAKRDFDKYRKKAIKAVQNFELPEVVYKEIDKCKVEEEPDEIMPVSDIQKTEAPVGHEDMVDDENRPDDEIENEEDKDGSKNESVSDETNEEIILIEEEPTKEIKSESEAVKTEKQSVKEDIDRIFRETVQEEYNNEEGVEVNKNDNEIKVNEETAKEETTTEDTIKSEEDENIKPVAEKKDTTETEYSPIKIEESTYKPTQVKQETKKSKKANKVSAKKRAKEAAKKLAK